MKFSIFFTGSLIRRLIARFQLAITRHLESIQESGQHHGMNSPVAQIDPNGPIQLCVLNQSNVEIIATLTEPIVSELYIQPYEFATFERLSKHSQLPIDLTLYTKAKKTALSLKVEVVGNELKVEIIAKIANQGSSRSLRVDKEGTIYIY